MRHTFSELGQGLRRNISMHVAVVLTLFVSLTLVGAGALITLESSKVSEQLGNQLQVTAWLCKDRDTSNPACVSEVTDAQKADIASVVQQSPEVESYYFESKETTFKRVQERLGDRLAGPNSPVTVDDMPQSLWITLKDPNQDAGVKSAVAGLDGVSYIQDQRAELAPIYTFLDNVRGVSWGTALVLLVAALLLVANTVRLAALARRREIAIMRLVGASTLYIALPFLLEALVTAAIGVALTAGALVAFMELRVPYYAETFRFLPWIGTGDLVTALIVVAVLGPVLTVVPTLLLTGKYLKV